MAKYGKRTVATRKAFEGKVDLTVEQAVNLVKSTASAKFDETVEIAVNLGVDPKHADQMVRGVINLPNGTGRTVRVAVFARDAKAEEAKAAGADIVGAEDYTVYVNRLVVRPAELSSVNLSTGVVTFASSVIEVDDEIEVCGWKLVS